jgi:hypothetical protein
VCWEDVLREDVYEERDDGEGEDHLIDEVEGYELWHGGLDRDLPNMTVLALVHHIQNSSTLHLHTLCDPVTYHVPAWCWRRREPRILNCRLLLHLCLDGGRLGAEGGNGGSAEGRWSHGTCRHLQRCAESALGEHLGVVRCC